MKQLAITWNLILKTKEHRYGVYAYIQWYVHIRVKNSWLEDPKSPFQISLTHTHTDRNTWTTWSRLMNLRFREIRVWTIDEWEDMDEWFKSIRYLGLQRKPERRGNKMSPVVGEKLRYRIGKRRSSGGGGCGVGETESISSRVGFSSGNV